MEQTMTTDEAIRHFGSKAKLAAALGIWPHGIYTGGANARPSCASTKSSV
jgi:hypothetical protein